MIVLRTNIEDKALLVQRLLTDYFGYTFTIVAKSIYWELHNDDDDLGAIAKGRIQGFAQCIAEHYNKLKSN